MEAKTYEVEAVRSGQWWALRMPELPGVHSQARRLEEAEEMARDAIALALEVPHDAFGVNIVARVNDKVDTALAEARLYRELAEQAAASTQRAVAIAREAGLPVRDIAHELNVSFQYIAKLAARSGEGVTTSASEAGQAAWVRIADLLTEYRTTFESPTPPPTIVELQRVMYEIVASNAVAEQKRALVESGGRNQRTVVEQGKKPGAKRVTV